MFKDFQMGHCSRKFLFSCYAAFLSIHLVQCVVGELMKRETSCGPTEIPCTSWIGTRCLDAITACDLKNDCHDGSDEANCPTDCSGSHHFKCQGDGKCISIRDRCNGKVDCKDHSDEAFCSSYRCPGSLVKCDNNIECYDPNDRCDETPQCSDWTDERGCYDFDCDDDEFECTNKDKGHWFCIYSEYVCDGNKDCFDGSDEANCTGTCPSDKFDCGSDGTANCLSRKYLCDGNDDCGNGKDESVDQCHGKVEDGNCDDLMQYESCFYMNNTMHPICTVPDDAKKMCRKFCNLC